MHTLRIVPAAALAFGLALIGTPRTASAEESEAQHEANRVAHDRVLCRGYGYDEGTDDSRHCLEVLAQRRADAKAEEAAKRRQASSTRRALSAAENNACDTRSGVINGGARGPSHAHETGVGSCSH